MNKDNENVYFDYLRDAAHFLWAARKLCEAAPENTDDREWIISNPLHFLIGHAAELVLKAGLIRKGFDRGELKKHNMRHDLDNLLEVSKQNDIPIDGEFKFFCEIIADNFKSHEYRYTKSLSQEELREMSSKINELLPLIEINGGMSKKELRKHGIIEISKVSEEKFIIATERQIERISN